MYAEDFFSKNFCSAPNIRVLMPESDAGACHAKVKYESEERRN